MAAQIENLCRALVTVNCNKAYGQENVGSPCIMLAGREV